MENKISLLDLTALVAKKTGQKQVTVKAFLSSIGPQLSEAILADGLVKMGGLGTFKMLQVEARKSVDVNTGEAILIEGYNKVTFLPEGGVKERINAPFADLPTMVVGEDGIPSIPEPDMSADRVSEVDPLMRLGAQADEIMDLVADINGVMPADEAESDVVSEPAPDVVSEPASEEVTEIAPEEVVEIAPEEVPETTPEVVAGTEPEVIAGPVVESVPEAAPEVVVTPETTVANPEPISAPVEQPQVDKSKKTDWSWFKAAVMVVVLFMAIVGITVALLMKHLDKWIDEYRQEKKELREERLKQDEIEAESVTPVVVEEVVEAVEDTTPVTSVVTEPEVPSIQEKTKAVTAPTAEESKTSAEEKIDFAAPRDYKKFGTKFTVTLEPGETLAALSRKYFGAYYFWVYIYEANRDRYPNANDISKGSKLRIPRMPKGYVDAYNKEARDYAKSLEKEYAPK